MAVLVEGISVIIRRDSIASKYRGGWEAFVADVPNATLCHDEEIARVGFMSPSDVQAYEKHLESRGLQFLNAGMPVDFAIADQQRGLTTKCNWLEWGRFPFGEAGEVAACWFFDEPRRGAGIHMRGPSMDIAMPVGWTFEGSLSHKFRFTPT